MCYPTFSLLEPHTHHRSKPPRPCQRKARRYVDRSLHSDVAVPRLFQSLFSLTTAHLGFGLRGTRTVLDIVRLDNDNDGKGIHFNVRRRAGDNSEKLAAVIQPTVGMDPWERQERYFEYLAELEPIASAVTVWNAWWAGTHPRS